MKSILHKIPANLQALFLRLGIALLMMSITRFVFYIYNSTSFTLVGLSDYFVGIWFDMITIGLLFIPYYALFLLPIPIHENKIHRIFFKLLFHATNSLIIAFNLVDAGYFRYTNKRSTFDLFTTVGTGNDMNQLWLTFLKDFWPLVVIFILLIVISELLYRKTEKFMRNRYQRNFKGQLFSFIIVVPVMFIIGRGGFGLKPVGIIEASNYTSPENTSFIVNTPFTLIKTIDQKGIEVKDYFSEEECNKIFNPIRTSQPQNILPDGTNVMIILLESFGTEFIGTYNHGESYTPFLDSLLGESFYFEYGFANGKKSIEAIPSIIASIPTLMDAPYIHSPYGNNQINALPKILKKHGYSSAFYHGATNGSMSFDGFAKICGYDQYVGRTEYNNEEHSDMTWGILDEYFNPWTAQEMSKLPEPFFATLFTLSSHHPYFIPKHMRTKVKQGSQQLCASLNYGDIALRKFFEEAKKQPWYDNTLFVVLADHSPASITPLFSQRTHLYRIPIAFYHPKGLLKKGKSTKIFQQLDIYPTLLDLLNIDESYYSYGTSLYQQPEREAFAYMEGSYFYFRDNFMLTFTGEQVRNLYNYKSDDMPPIDSLNYYSSESKNYERRLKGIIQRYNQDLIRNQTKVND